MLDLEQLETAIFKLDLPKYRSKQIFNWIYEKGCLNFEDMTNLSKDLRSVLKRNFYFPKFKLENKQISKDGAIKCLFELDDGSFIETVIIPANGRNTICLSTQVGCKFGCIFCASGINGFKRDLTASEIVMQVMYLKFQEISGVLSQG